MDLYSHLIPVNEIEPLEKITDAYSGPVPVVRGRQAAPVPQLDQACGLGAPAPARLQVVPGREQPGRCVGHWQWGVRGHDADRAGEDV